MSIVCPSLDAFLPQDDFALGSLSADACPPDQEQLDASQAIAIYRRLEQSAEDEDSEIGGVRDLGRVPR